MLPSDTLAAHADLSDRWNDPRFRRYILRVCSSQATPGGRTRRVPEKIVEIGQTATRAAYCYRVSGDMTRLVQHAANGLDQYDQYDNTLPPTQAGLAHFEGGLRAQDSRGRAQHLDWLLWGMGFSPDRPGLTVWWFNDLRLNPDEFGQAVRREPGATAAIGRWAFVAADVLPNGARLGPVGVMPDPFYSMKITADGDTPSAATNHGRLAHAFWAMLGQTVTYSAPAIGLPPKVTGTAKKAKIRKTVTVVDLRRRVNVNATGERRDTQWTRQWIVRGFWRNQRHGPGNALVKRVWIAPYVKGPAEAPFVMSDKVYDLKR